MKTYRELYFRGNEEQLKSFVDDFKEYSKGNWKTEKTSEQWNDYLFIDYLGNDVEKARVSIFTRDTFSTGVLKVGNIIPLQKNELSIEEYNDVLMKFYNEVIKPYKEKGTELDIPQPSDDIFDPLTVVTDTALKKLRSFCFGANKSTGSSHPSDRERWFDFICQTVDDNSMFDYSTLSEFLQDESYWGKKDANFIGVMGNFAWDREKAEELAFEYENACEILQYYKKSRGL